MKPGLTLEQHRDLGPRVKALREEIIEIHNLIAGAYRMKSRELTVIALMFRVVDRLRSRLDSAGFREHGDAFSTRVYYGKDTPP